MCGNGCVTCVVPGETSTFLQSKPKKCGLWNNLDVTGLKTDHGGYYFNFESIPQLNLPGSLRHIF